MNPIGPPAAVNDAYTENNPTTVIYGDWLVVYSWPAVADPTPRPASVILENPSILQKALFKCCCKEPPLAEMYPIAVRDGPKLEVKACELVDQEADVAAALNRATCSCQATRSYEKIVALQVGEHLLVYQRHKNETYTPEDPNDCLLLVKELPEDFDINAIVGELGNMDVVKRDGGCTFQI